jgi:putative intracellular protease/amidase
VAIVADNRGTETTDLMIPHAVLTRSQVADVVVVAVSDGDITLMPALTIAPQATLDEFDAGHPDGADYVIVPAMHHDDSEGPVVNWIRRQAASGAIIVGICEGAKVLGRAGLLDGRRATTHWYAADSLRAAYPGMRWTPSRRYVVDRGVVTTTGVTASIPVSLMLVEAIGGRPAAQALANQVGVSDYGSAHDSARYHLGAASVWRVIANSAAVWRREIIGIPVDNGVDGLALALTADAWARTYRSRVLALGQQASITTAVGLRLRTVARAGEQRPDLIVRVVADSPSASALDRALLNISTRYGGDTADLVALQLEYPWQAEAQ